MALALSAPVLALIAVLLLAGVALQGPQAFAQTTVEPAQAAPDAAVDEVAPPGEAPEAATIPGEPQDGPPENQPALQSGIDASAPEPDTEPTGTASQGIAGWIAILNQLDNEARWLLGGVALAAFLLLGLLAFALMRIEGLRRAMLAYGGHMAVTGVVLAAYAYGYLSARQISYILLSVAFFAAVQRFLKTDIAKRFGRMLAEDVVTNWRLLLLGLTGVLLSIASGYTTWDGMTNFTCPARTAEEGTCLGPMVLSGLITFGIQGVMLIAAWLIGESFAQGLRTGGDDKPGTSHRIAGYLIAVPLIGMAALALLAVASIFMTSDANGLANGIAGFSGSLTTLFAVLIGLTAILFAVSQRGIIEPYVQGLRIVLANLPIWIMFLACMATSVFFSFDSLFSTIFPPEERARAAELRTSNQVAGLVADAGVITRRRQIETVDQLFRSEEWTGYSERIGSIVEVARGAPEEIRNLQREELEARQAERASLQERKASALGQQKRLATRKDAVIETLGRLKEEIPPIAATVEEMKRKVFDSEKSIIQKKAEAEAEAGGVGGTGKAGRGPEFAKRKKELDDLEKLKAIDQTTLDDFLGQLRAKRDAVANAEAELAGIDAEIGKMQGEIEVAEGQISIATEAGEAAPRIDVTGGFASLEAAFAQFRQRPERATFDAMQSHCGVLLNVFDKVPSLKEKAAAARVTCDPSIVAERTTRVFALNEGLLAFREACAKPDSLPQTGTDAVLEFGEKCIQISGLAGEDTAALRNRLNGVALNRDDRAHRFVVTWNAFLDGNRLAYLALAIAVAIDGLVFMSGLFGANAVRSRLSDLPGGKDRSASDLEAMIDAALLPNPYANARLVLDSLRPITETEGYSARVDLATLDPASADIVSRVLTQGASLAAVRQDQADPELFLVRGQLIEYLSVVCKRELSRSDEVRKGAEAERLAAEERRVERERRWAEDRDVLARQDAIEDRARRLEPHLEASLVPDVLVNATVVHFYMKPLGSDSRQYSAIVELDGAKVPDRARRIVGGVLATAASFGEAVRDSSMNDKYLMRPEFSISLARIRERLARGVTDEALLRRTEDKVFSIIAEKTTAPAIERASAQEALSPPVRAEAIAAAAHPATLPPPGEKHPGSMTPDDAMALDEARKGYIAQYLHYLGLSHEEAESLLSQDREIQAQFNFLRTKSGPQEMIDELTSQLNRAIDDKHRELALVSTPDTRIVLADVTRDIRKLVPGVVLKQLPADLEQEYQGAIN